MTAVGDVHHGTHHLEELPQVVHIPSDAELCIQNLRLLDLDRLPDWPNLTTQSFRIAKDLHTGQRDRVRTGEWILYRLFEILDPKETRIKLEPYFPAFEAAQAVKLRTAFIQWLTQLKTSGALARECALRKSLFDECKGDKFEEILFHLSTLVLQKVVQEKNKGKQMLPWAQRLGVDQNFSAKVDNMVRYSLLAHQVGVQSHATQRKVVRGRMNTLAQIIRDRHDTLERKKPQLEADAQDHDAKLKGAGVDARSMKKQLRHDCTGDTNWLSIIISGDSEQGRDGLIERSFSDVFAEGETGTPLTSIETESASLLSELEERVQSQQARLADWRDFQRQVSKRNETLIVSRSPFKSATKSPMKSPVKSPKSPSKVRYATPIRPAQGRAQAYDTPKAAKQTGSPKKAAVSLEPSPMLDTKVNDKSTLASPDMTSTPDAGPDTANETASQSIRHNAGTSRSAEPQVAPRTPPQTLGERTLQTLQQCRAPRPMTTQRFQSMLDSYRPQSSQTLPEFSSTEPSSAKHKMLPTDGRSKASSPPWRPQSRSKSPLKPSNEPPTNKVIHSSCATDNGDSLPTGEAAEGVRTPPEQLFEQDVDYASVFKSRSKLRHSPPASPLPDPLNLEGADESAAATPDDSFAFR